MIKHLLGILFFGRRLPPLPEDELPAIPPAHLPVLAVLGAALFVVGVQNEIAASDVQDRPIDGFAD